jgi:glycosyltransferase involved in cell wall biosynthesis
MKILYVITRANSGGAQVNVRALALGARKAGHNVLVAVGGTGWLTEEMSNACIPVVKIESLERSWNPISAVRYLLEIQKLCRNQNPEIIHFHSSNAIIGIFAFRGFGFIAWRLLNYFQPNQIRDPKLVATIHGLSALHPGWKRSRFAKWLYKSFMKKLLVKTDSVIYVCNADYNEAVSQRISLKQKSIVVKNGVQNPEGLIERKEARKTFVDKINKNELKLSSNYAGGDSLDCKKTGTRNIGDLGDQFFDGDRCFVVGTIARLDYQKNIQLLIDAVSVLKNRTKPFPIGEQQCTLKLIVIGWGPEGEFLSKEVENRKLGDSIKFIGEVPHASKLLRGFDLFVMTSRYEGLPYSLLEASLAGIPVISTDVGGVPEIISHGRTGRLVKVLSAEELADNIQWVKNNYREALNMAQQAKNFVELEYSENQMIYNMLNVYSSVGRQ